MKSRYLSMALGYSRLCILLFVILLSYVARAANSPSTFVYQGKLTNTAGTVALTESVDLTIGIYNPAGTCLLYQETQTVDTTSTGGVFSIEVGQTATTGGKRTADDPNLSMVTVFANTTSQIRAAGANCAGGYTPSAADTRSLRFTLTPISTGTPTTLSPDQVINSVPHAMIAQTLQGYVPLDFITVSGNVTQANMTTLTGAGDASTLHNHDGRYIQTGATASLGNNSYVSGSFGIGTSAPSTDLGFGGNADRTIGVNRNTTTAGSSLTINSGGALSGGTNLNGGTLSLSSGISTGTGSSSLEFKTASAGGSGTADNTPTTKMTILGNGNVGIGTASPNTSLTVQNLNSSGTASNFTQALTNGGFNIVTNYGAGSVYGPGIFWSTADNNPTKPKVGIFPYFNGSGSALNIQTSNDYSSGLTSVITIDSTGKLGIGTSSPTGLLHVASSTTATGVNTFEQASADTDSFDINFRKARGTVAAPTVITTADELGTLQFNGYSGAGGYVTGAAIKAISEGTIATTRVPAHLSFWTGTDAAPTVLTERMRIDKSGYVGIGTTSPSGFLHVSGTQPEIILQDGSTAAKGSIQQLGRDSFYLDNARFDGSNWLARDSVYPAWAIQLAAEGDAFAIFRAPASAGSLAFASLLKIANSGNVGIGTTSPNYKLDVAAGASTNIANFTASSNGTVGVINVMGEFGGRLNFGSGNYSIQGATGTSALEISSWSGVTTFVGGQQTTEVARFGKSNVDLTSYFNGNVGIGTTGPNEKLEVDGNIRLTPLNGGGTTTASIDNNGNIIRTVSDERLKTQIKPLEGSLERILKVQGVSYYWKNRENFGAAKDIGFIAQDLEKVVPEVVKQSNDPERMRSVNYANMVALLVEAIKEIYQDFLGQSREIASIKTENALLRYQNSQLENTTAKLESEVAALKTWICSQHPRPSFCN